MWKNKSFNFDSSFTWGWNCLITIKSPFNFTCTWIKNTYNCQHSQIAYFTLVCQLAFSLLVMRDWQWNGDDLIVWLGAFTERSGRHWMKKIGLPKLLHRPLCLCSRVGGKTLDGVRSFGWYMADVLCFSFWTTSIGVNQSLMTRNAKYALPRPNVLFHVNEYSVQFEISAWMCFCLLDIMACVLA